MSFGCFTWLRVGRIKARSYTRPARPPPIFSRSRESRNNSRWRLNFHYPSNLCCWDNIRLLSHKSPSEISFLNSSHITGHVCHKPNFHLLPVIYIHVYTRCGRITRTSGYEVIPREKIRTKYGTKFCHLSFSFRKNRVRICLVRNWSNTYMRMINFQIYFFGHKASQEKILFCIFDLFSHVEWPAADYLALSSPELITFKNT